VQTGQLELQAEGILEAAVAGALGELCQLEQPGGQPDVLEVQPELLVRPVVRGEGAMDLSRHIEAAGPLAVPDAACLLGGSAAARVQGAPGGEALPYAEHERVRLVQRQGPVQRDPPLLVLQLGIGQARCRAPAGFRCICALAVFREVSVSLEGDAHDGFQAGATGELGRFRRLRTAAVGADGGRDQAQDDEGNRSRTHGGS
jgi:hypothetical protein